MWMSKTPTPANGWDTAIHGPEQAAGAEAIGAAADVHGLGAILYACLTGVAPFADSDLNDVQTRLPTPPRNVYPDIDASLEAICLRCLEKHPDDRYLSAQALADDLERFLQGEPPLVAPLTARRSIRRILQQHTTVDRLPSARRGRGGPRSPS